MDYGRYSKDKESSYNTKTFKHVLKMKTYLEIKVPIKYDDGWFEELRTAFQGIPVRWQADYYHITIAFCDETPEDVDFGPILDKHLNTYSSQVLTFDTIGAFTTPSGMYIVHLGVIHIPSEFASLVDDIRKELVAAGCVMQSDFKLHVTLGRMKNSPIELSEIQDILKSYILPSMTRQLNEVDYRVFRGKVLYEKLL